MTVGEACMQKQGRARLVMAEQYWEAWAITHVTRPRRRGATRSRRWPQ